jgi:hypothetical protein
MKEEWVECKECRFWVEPTEEELKLKPGRVNSGLCYQIRSPKWLVRTQREDGCEFGELKTE